jgi:hypothetical protein
MLSEKLETDKLTYVASESQMEEEFLKEIRELKAIVVAKVSDGEIQRLF